MTAGHKPKGIAELAAVFFLVAVPSVGGQTNSPAIEPEPSRDQPLVEIDMRQFGYKPQGGEEFSLAFTKSNDLLVAWTTSDESQNRTKIRSTTPVSSQLHALVFNSRTGQKERGGEWPSRYLQATITPVGNENFLICATDEIRLLSYDFAPVREQVLPAPTTCQGMRVSPNRHSFSTRTGTEYSLLDAESFQLLAKWTSKEAVDVHFTDSLLVGICRPKTDFCVRGSDQDWRSLHVAGISQYPRAFGHQATALVNDSALAIAYAGKITVVTFEGAVLFRASSPKKFSFGAIATSTGGKRFAYIETEMRGSRTLDMYSNFDDHVVVYDLNQNKAIYTRKVKGGSPWIPPFEHRNRIALSSDGAFLAILGNGLIDVYQLPLAGGDHPL